MVRGWVTPDSRTSPSGMNVNKFSRFFAFVDPMIVSILGVTFRRHETYLYHLRRYDQQRSSFDKNQQQKSLRRMSCFTSGFGPMSSPSLPLISTNLPNEGARSHPIRTIDGNGIIIVDRGGCCSRLEHTFHVSLFPPPVAPGSSHVCILPPVDPSKQAP
jgi:hypothetical protein